MKKIYKVLFIFLAAFVAVIISTRQSFAAPSFSIPNATVAEGYGPDITQKNYPAPGSQDTFTITDQGSSSWTGTADYGDGSGTQSLTISGNTFQLGHLYQNKGVYTVTVSITNSNGDIGTATAKVTVENVAPQIYAYDWAYQMPVQANSPVTFRGDFWDPGILTSDTYSAVWDWGDGTTSAGTITIYQSSVSGTIQDSHTYAQAGTYIIKLTVTDKDGGTTTHSSDAPPKYILTDKSVYTQDEDIFFSQGRGSPDNSFEMYNKDTGEFVGEGFAAQGDFYTVYTEFYKADLNSNISRPLPVGHYIIFEDNSPYCDQYPTILSLSDCQAISNDSTEITVISPNTPPSVGTITASPNPVQINNATTASATFTDANTSDTHTASWNWGDGNTTAGSVTESNGSGSVSNSHTYTSAGVYPITLTVTDNNGASGQATFQYISVYNPTAQGLFSAGQKYTSPAGAYTANTSLTGNALFGLSYKYQGTVPTGNRQFSMDFNQANLHFNATSISALVISNGIGTLTGTGTVNGSGTYNFLVTGSESANTIRIQIKDSSNNVIYDTQPGAADTATPTTSVTAGTVLAH